ncbi:MAG TPA: nitrate reductase molybdenum cofactor assembly chaperone [Frankiaceae bacterium]|nr:nitrate reductase molybdenum cofactor assembly chaperone [Frankiaceae bacterium]
MSAGARDRAVVHQVASLLLQYPDDALTGRLPLLSAAVDTLPAGPRQPLRRFLDHLAGTPPPALAADYVATFDLRRASCLYLTYYAYGDTRRRGMALLRFQDAYRRAGLTLTGGELPDFLPVVLEFSATGDARAAGRLLAEHRAGLELLRTGLREHGSPYADVLDAVCLTLPPVGPRDLAAALRLAKDGPPREDVGLQPFGPPGVSGPGGRR